jgi:peptidoglycan/xylan/chitin deacetylase (PgdA/CDA1 family)/glycosyltransferase involved in cell wall biosynthesis
MRILFLSSVFPRPYAPTRGIYCYHLCKALAAMHDVRVVSPQSWTERFRQGALASVEPAGAGDFHVDYPVYYYPPGIWHNGHGWWMWRSIRRRVRRVVEEFRPDCVLSYWVHPDGDAAVRAARLAGVPAALMTGGSDVLLVARDDRRRRTIQRVLQQADAVLAVSRDLQREVEKLGVPAGRIFKVERGIDAAIFAPGDSVEARRRLGLPESGKMLLWVGRMVPVKALEVLLQAGARLQQGGHDFRLYLVGDGPLRLELQSQAATLGLDKQVVFPGVVGHEALGDWYRAADLTVLSSRSEGVPNVLRESMACGTPFVATAVGGVPEITPGPPCRLVSPGDPVALADAIATAPPKGGPGADLPSISSTWSQAADGVLDVLRPLVESRPPKRTTAERRSPLRQLLRSALTLLPRRMFLVRGPAAGNRIALTFDDGPHPEHTPRLLDVLRQHNIVATFFVVGSRAESHPDIVRRIVAEGHALGNHTFTHANPRSLSARAFLDEVHRTNDLLTSLVGRGTRLVRPPHGKAAAGKLWRLWRARQSVVLWNVDPKDFAASSADEVRGYFQARPLHAGDVILMHDTWPYAAEVLPYLAGSARQAGLTFTTPTQWIG